jgi:hypothetical protein
MSTKTQPNPYASPQHTLLYYQPKYVWPLLPDRHITAHVFIDKEQLTKCLQEDHNLTIWPRAGFFFCTLVLILLLGLQPDWRLFLSSWIVLVVFGVFAVQALPRMFLNHHVKRICNRSGWLWGNVDIDMHSHGVEWVRDDFKYYLLWDSIHQFEVGDRCIWLSTVYPCALRLPIHRDWVTQSEWQELLQIAESHPYRTSLANRFQFYGFRKARSISFEGVAAPDHPRPSDCQLRFRTDGTQTYASEWLPRIAVWLQRSVALIYVGFFALPIFLSTWVQANYYIYQDFLIWLIAFPSLLTWAMGWLPFGIRWDQQSQPLIRCQSGYVTADLLHIASPAYSLSTSLGDWVALEHQKTCTLVRFRGNPKATIVIPRDQCE